ncbi:hypothetical protein M426DRAFT_54328 [Hypoxylon sp. CI-4A]|nr:hypothetical protein M426DRAFT_54328 [Hypoxylon sp. CI-4A]
MSHVTSDEEKNEQSTVKVEVDSSSDASSHPHQESKIEKFLARLRSYEDSLDRKLGVEAHSIQRRLPDDRDPFFARWPGQLVMLSFWTGGCMNLGSFATGFLGKELGLDLRQSILIIIFGTITGSLVTSWCATMGPPTGLRQVSICRYSLGWYPAKVIAILNVIQQVGWCASGSITSGQALSAFSNGKVGTDAGVVICSVISLAFSFFGLTAVYKYAKYACVVFVVAFLIMFGEVAKSGDFSAPAAAEGVTGSGAALTFFGIMYGMSACCAGYASDYYVEYPARIPKSTVFILTFLGLTLPTFICCITGAIVASALPTNQEWSEQYDAGIGFLIQTMIHPYGLGKTLLFLMMFTAIGLNSASMYSASLSIQLSTRRLAVIPRFIWTLICFVAIIALGLAGSDRLLVFLQNFLSLLGYYATAVFVCLVTEHYLFRGGSIDNYNLEAWDKPDMLPVGYAGGLALACGIVGAVLGMVTTWYTGVIAGLIGGSGGDIGNELCLIFTVILYIPVRFVEMRRGGK